MGVSGFGEYRDAWRKRFEAVEAARGQRAAEARRLVPSLVRHLVEHFGVGRVILWGSLATGGFHERSDIDLVVEGLPPGTGLFRALAELQDLAAGFRVELIPWEDLTEATRDSVLREGELDHGKATD